MEQIRQTKQRRSFLEFAKDKNIEISVQRYLIDALSFMASGLFASLLIDNTFLHNSLLLSLVVQCFMISPAVYKIFKLPYDNYKAYQNMG